MSRYFSLCFLIWSFLQYNKFLFRSFIIIIMQLDIGYRTFFHYLLQCYRNFTPEKCLSHHYGIKNLKNETREEKTNRFLFYKRSFQMVNYSGQKYFMPGPRNFLHLIAEIFARTNFRAP